MDELKNISFMKIKKDLPFKVPSGYFESLPERLNEKIHLKNVRKTGNRIFSLKSYVAAAVIVIVALAGGRLFFKDGKEAADLNAQISQTVEWELYSIPETVILEVISGKSPEAEPDVETDEIIDYLVDEDIPYEDLLNGF